MIHECLCTAGFPDYLRFMKPPSLPTLLCCSLLLLCACHSKPSAQKPVALSKTDSPRPTASQTANPTLEARDTPREAPKESYDTLDPVLRSHFRDVQAFLECIRRPANTTDGDFDAWIKKFRVANVDSFLSFITADSLEIDDADGGPDTAKYSRTELRRQLSQRKGTAFQMIGEISLHISIPYPQYSHTTFATDKSDSIPNLIVSYSEFVLYFRAEKGSASYKMYQIDSYQISDK